MHTNANIIKPVKYRPSVPYQERKVKHDKHQH